ncbi:uncharacterized protein LOC119635878 [Glossina fuscipes]|uniref:Uncharacterized protein LOC119635878 n=1 Tax=Glossina fuscipes TaxID=7396 RepID=A0A8U0WMD5_9MUSC|nr:uncharacterized protein LOC119635878 [Glossina fuscipes]
MNNLCGLRLSTVGMVVGWLNLVGGLLSTILLSIGLTRLDDIVDAIYKSIGPDSDLDSVDIRLIVLIAISVYLTTSLANVIASMLLIIGTVKERHLLLAPWLINAYIFIFFNAVNFVYMIFVSIFKDVPVGVAIPTLLYTGISLVIQIVIWNAIYSLYKQIRANRDQQQRLLTAPTTLPDYTRLPYEVK